MGRNRWVGFSGRVEQTSEHVYSPAEEEDPRFWNVKGKEALLTALEIKANLHKAKNLILFLGDGKTCKAKGISFTVCNLAIMSLNPSDTAESYNIMSEKSDDCFVM